MADQFNSLIIRSSGEEGRQLNHVIDFLRSGSLTDVQVVFTNNNVYSVEHGVAAERPISMEVCACHKVVLAASSELFHNFFKHEATRPDIVEIVFFEDNIPSVHFKYILHFIYHGEVAIPRNDFGGLLETASKLKIKYLESELNRMMLADPTLGASQNVQEIKREVDENLDIYIIKEISKNKMDTFPSNFPVAGQDSPRVPPIPKLLQDHPTLPTQMDSFVTVTSKIGSELITWRTRKSVLDGIGSDSKHQYTQQSASLRVASEPVCVSSRVDVEPIKHNKMDSEISNSRNVFQGFNLLQSTIEHSSQSLPRVATDCTTSVSKPTVTHLAACKPPQQRQRGAISINTSASKRSRRRQSGGHEPPRWRWHPSRFQQKYTDEVIKRVKDRDAFQRNSVSKVTDGAAARSSNLVGKVTKNSHAKVDDRSLSAAQTGNQEPYHTDEVLHATSLTVSEVAAQHIANYAKEQICQAVDIAMKEQKKL